MLKPRELMNLVQYRNELYGGTVRIGDYLLPKSALKIYLRDHEGHVRAHPKVTRIIDSYRTGLYGKRYEFRRQLRRGREQGDIDPLKRVLLQELYRDLIFTKFVDLTY